MLKKILAILLISTMALSFAACGSKESSKDKSSAAATEKTEKVEKVAAEDEAADEDTADADTAAYEEGMSSIITSYETLLTQLTDLLGTYDGTEEWWTAYKAVYDASSGITDQVATLADVTPDEYADSYSSIVVAMAAYTDGMDALGTAMDLEAGAEQDDAVTKAKALFDAADELWSSAVE